MGVRYEGSNGEPDLILVDRSTGSGTALGDLCTLLDWHIDDPVDAGEQARNDRIELIQGNRNLFVDDPDLALRLFGVSCGIEPDDVTDEPVVASDEPVLDDEPMPTPEPATSVRLATWNMANFWHVEGEHLRPAPDGGAGLQGDAEDYAAIRDVIAELDADIIGLQEIGSPQSLETILPPSAWDYVFSRRFSDDLAADSDKLESGTTRDIYTAVVVRRSAETIVGTERIELDILHDDDRPVREGTAALVDVGGMRLWAASLHLKSGCHFDNDLTQREDCRTLAKQLPILEDWLDEKSDAGLQTALLGTSTVASTAGRMWFARSLTTTILSTSSRSRTFRS